MKNKNIYVCYYDIGGGYRADQFIEGSYELADFTPICNYPVSESNGKSDIDIALEVYSITMQREWVEKFNRPLRYGDIVVVESRVMLYIPTADMDMFSAAGWRTTALPINDTAITYLPDGADLVEELCSPVVT